MTRTLAHQTAQPPADYPLFLAELKARIAAARTRAALAVNSELIKLYWEIGQDILERERQEGWGAKVIDRLSADLRRDFPEMRGLSRSNLHYMRLLAAAWPDASRSSSPPSSVLYTPVARAATCSICGSLHAYSICAIT